MTRSLAVALFVLPFPRHSAKAGTATYVRAFAGTTGQRRSVSGQAQEDGQGSVDCHHRCGIEPADHRSKSVP